MEIYLAKSAGFCFGVKLAVNSTYEKAREGKVYTYGPIIHNKTVINDLKSLGVEILEELKEEVSGEVIIRSHGVNKETYEFFDENKIIYTDCTCPFVKKIHKIVSREYNEGKGIIIVGSSIHPEIIGINGWCENSAIIINSIEDAENTKWDETKEYILVVQTTYRFEVLKEIIEVIHKNVNFELFNTICNATTERQVEAEELSKKVDFMIVLGDIESSNSKKLFEICQKNCKNTFLCETIDDLQLNIFEKGVKIGITAGASTPPEIIKGALLKMNEMENKSFEELLNESFITLRNGDIVTGTVISVNDNEVFVNLGYKSDGVIEKKEFLNDMSLSLRDQINVGDEIEVSVLRVNDGDGNVLLSKKRVASSKGYEELEKAFNENEIVKGTVVDIVKGGLVALINEVRVFVPASQISNQYIDDLNQFKNQEFDFNIIEFNRSKRRIIAGRKDLARKEQEKIRSKVLEGISVGNKIEGIINRIVDFGAFVDLGGIDGLIHISELSWGRIRKVSEVLSVGDKVSAYILNIDKEKGKVSLSLKDIEKNPWNNAEEKYSVGNVVNGRIVRLVDFGAFVELEQGIDGLVHISQISLKHINKPEEVLEVGQEVTVKVIDFNLENKKINLSIKDADDSIEITEE